MLSPKDGGAETFFEKLAIEFQQRGVAQRLVVCRHAERERRLRDAGCEVDGIAAQGWPKWLAPKAVSRIRSTFLPDVQLAWMSRAANSLREVRGVVNVARLGGYYPLKYYRTCHHLIANTPGVAHYLKEAGWPSDRLSIISNFGEVPDRIAGRSLREDLDLPEGSRVILGVGRLHANKAHDVSLRVLAELPDCVLLLVGSGQLRLDLERLAADLGVTERVRFLGWRRDIENLYATADAVLFPSRVEPLGNVVLEAWSFGKPIVAAASEGPSWLIEHERNGLLVPVDDVPATASAVRKILDEEGLREDLTAAGRTKLESEFSRGVIVGEYEELFAKLAGSR